jgi:hypothetical protein
MRAGFGPESRRQGVGWRDASQADGRWQIGKYGGERVKDIGSLRPATTRTRTWDR